MGCIPSRALPLAVFATIAVTPGPASAQCRLCSQPTTARPNPESSDAVQLQIDSSIDFDRLILFGAGDGAAVLHPDGSSAAQGAIANVGPRAMVGTARIHGQPGRAVRIELPQQIILYSLGGGQIRFDEVISDLPAIPHLDAAGNLNFRFGGRVRITGDADGSYRGDLPITVEYQ